MTGLERLGAGPGGGVPGLRQSWTVLGMLALLAYDREDLMIAALASIVVAGVVVSLGAWILLVRERRRR